MSQSTIFQPLHHNQYAELCVALYERELESLSRYGSENAVSLKRRLASLPFYIKRAADLLACSQTPLSLDVQNASWQSKQTLKPPGMKHSAEGLHKWLTRYARLGLVLPIQVQEQGLTSIWLDSLDRVTGEGVHVNRFGWFDFYGRSDSQSDALLLKPCKSVMTAACCGHQWDVKGRVAPRTLSLREVLLAATLSWPKFTSVEAISD